MRWTAKAVNYNMSYADIVAWLAEQGYKVSQSSLSRYAFKVFESQIRVLSNLGQQVRLHLVKGKLRFSFGGVVRPFAVSLSLGPRKLPRTPPIGKTAWRG